ADVPVYQLDGQGRVTLVGFSDGSSRSYTYDSGSGKISTFTDERGHVTSYTYDGSGNRLTETDPLGQTTTYTYNGLNQVTGVAQPPPDGVISQTAVLTTYLSDADHRLTGVSYAEGRSDHVTYAGDPRHVKNTTARGCT